MTWANPDIALAFLILLLILFAGFSLWRKLSENETLKYEFISVITHKFRTPMTHIKWIVADMVQSEKDPYRRQNLAELQRSNEDMVKLVGALTEAMDTRGTGKSVYKFERLNLADLTKGAFALSDHSFKEKNISITLDFHDATIFVKADRTRLEFVLSTIIENACMYTPVGQKTWISAEAKRDKAIVTVQDDGIGISPFDMRRVSTKFFRAKTARVMDTEGFGVNLFLARSIINRLHGKLEIYSAGSKMGSTFRVILPRVK